MTITNKVKYQRLYSSSITKYLRPNIIGKFHVLIMISPISRIKIISTSDFVFRFLRRVDNKFLIHVSQQPLTYI